MTRFFRHAPARLFLALMLAGSALITWYSIPYFDFGTLPPFVIEKLPVRFERLWLFSLRVHVASVSLAFPLCLLLLTRVLQRRPAWHRRIGRATGVLVLLALIPSGTVLAFDAKGGTVVTIGFLLSAAIVTWGMVYGVVTARRKELVQHRRAMHHVVAQMSVAVVSRAMLVGFDFAEVDPDVAYVVALWVPVVLGALVVEFRQNVFSRYFDPTILGRIRREISPASLLSLLRQFRLPRLVARAGR